MLIVIDLSGKLVGYNLFESFIYKFKHESNLVLANNPLTLKKFNYDELRIKIQNILYTSHTNSFSLCVLYDMNEQKNDPLKESIVNNIHNIEEKIIKPLSMEYVFDKLYYFSLDDVKRDNDLIPYDQNVRLAIDFDSLGYIREEYDSEYREILFTSNEIDKCNYIWEDIKNRDNDLNFMLYEIKEELYLLFSKKKDLIKSKYKDLSWYADRLDEVYKMVVEEIEDALYKNANNIDKVKKISEFMIDGLKRKVSSYRNRDIIYIHINLNKLNYLNKGISKYRHQIEILAIIMYLATNDTKFVFEGNKYLGKENHFEISTNLNEENLVKMLKSYNSKLKLEFDNISKLKCNEVEYNDFELREFNLSLDNNKIPSVPKFLGLRLFYKKRDVGSINNYIKGLYERYLIGIDYANKLLNNLTVKLRKQKEATCFGFVKKGNVSELILIVKKMQQEVNLLQQKIALFQPKEVCDVSNKLKIEYYKTQSNIEELINKRISFRTFVVNIILIIITSFGTYKMISELILPFKLTDILSILVLVLPIIVYVLLQITSLIKIKRKIDKMLVRLRKSNDNEIYNLYRDDSKMIDFIKDTYELIMKKKYIDECNMRINVANEKFKKIEYHYNKLKEHIEANNRLIEVLGIDMDKIEIIEIDKINNLDINKDIYLNKLYCPLNYLSLIEDIENKVIVNDEQVIDVDSDLIGFVDKFNITYDKEYRHE